MPPSSATIRGMAGLTIIWLMEATNMPSMRPTKTRLASGESEKGSGFAETVTQAA